MFPDTTKSVNSFYFILLYDFILIQDYGQIHIGKDLSNCVNNYKYSIDHLIENLLLSIDHLIANLLAHYYCSLTNCYRSPEWSSGSFTDVEGMSKRRCNWLANILICDLKELFWTSFMTRQISAYNKTRLDIVD